MKFRNTERNHFTILSNKHCKSMVFVIITIATLLFSCDSEENKAKYQKELLTSTMTSLYQGDINGFLSHADYSVFDIENDSTRRNIISILLQKHINKMQSIGKGVSHIEATDAKFESDSTIYVFYNIHFNNGTKRSLSQKMTCTNGEWKLRMKD
ncbi:MAG: hypothetical protein J5805_03895 [Bacteroidaceae bacterium]|nr:hypothetical protein [Bacteroidaceae bacterium]